MENFERTAVIAVMEYLLAENIEQRVEGRNKMVELLEEARNHQTVEKQPVEVRQKVEDFLDEIGIKTGSAGRRCMESAVAAVVVNKHVLDNYNKGILAQVAAERGSTRSEAVWRAIDREIKRAWENMPESIRGAYFSNPKGMPRFFPDQKQFVGRCADIIRRRIENEEGSEEA